MEDIGNLCNILDLDKDFIIELKYASSDNFTGQAIYSSETCLIDKDTAALLIKAKDYFKADGYRVKIWDAYRPISAQKKFWEIYPNDDYVAMPPDMDKLTTFRPSHLNGQCVDITLTDMDGKEIEMPCEFDDFTERSGVMCQSASIEGRKNALYMRFVMEKAGFRPYDCEWWHFYDMVNEPRRFLDYPL